MSIYIFRKFFSRLGTSLNLSRKAGDITMVKITLYNNGGQKEVLFYIVLCTSFLSVILIPNELKESKEDMYLGRRIQVLRCFTYFLQKYCTLRELHSIQSSQFKCYAKHITAQHQAIYPIQSIMASPCKLNKNIFSIFFKMRVYKKNKNAIIYIYIIYRNMKTIISKILNIRKKFLTSSFIYIIIIYVRKLTTTVGFIVMNFIVVISY